MASKRSRWWIAVALIGAAYGLWYFALERAVACRSPCSVPIASDSSVLELLCDRDGACVR